MWINWIGRADAVRQPVRHRHHVGHVGRLDHVLVVGIAVAEVKQQLDVGGHMVGEIDQDARRRSLRLGLAARRSSTASLRSSRANTADATSNWIAI